MFNKFEICKRANHLTTKGYTKTEAFKMAWREAREAATAPEAAEVVTISDIVTKAREFKKIQKMIEELEARQNAIKESIINEMDGAEEVSADIFKIRYITVVSNRFDTTGFKKIHADIYNEYLKENVCKRFTVSAWKQKALLQRITKLSVNGNRDDYHNTILVYHGCR